MLTQPQIDKLKQHPGLGWITALTSTAIRELVKQGALQLSFLDEKNLAEITAPDYPGERLMVCHNPVLGEQRKRKRQALLEATEKSLERISKEVARRKKKPFTAAEIGVKVGKVLGRYKMGKHLACTIGEGRFTWSRRADSIEQEEKLDGIYVLRTSEPVERLSAKEETVRSYKSLAEVERAFRCLKGIDLLVRLIRHRREDRVPAHIFLCVLAYYVEWHLRRAWAPLLFEDEERREERQRRDPILPAKPSDSAERKKRSHQTAGTVLPCTASRACCVELASRARVTYAIKPQKAEEKTNLTRSGSGAGANASAGPSLRIGSDVSAGNRKVACAIPSEINRILSRTSWNFGLKHRYDPRIAFVGARAARFFRSAHGWFFTADFCHYNGFSMVTSAGFLSSRNP